ncbi:hypothetical protein HBB16_20405 [Pseudonocardia sp. MCCB 268]|nr:hypothetical protein [Pseudonocardia cytotoxica]
MPIRAVEVPAGPDSSCCTAGARRHREIPGARRYHLGPGSTYSPGVGRATSSGSRSTTVSRALARCGAACTQAGVDTVAERVRTAFAAIRPPLPTDPATSAA